MITATDWGVIRGNIVRANMAVYHHDDRARVALEFLDRLLSMNGATEVAAPELMPTVRSEIAFVWRHGEKNLIVVPEEDAIRYTAEFGREYRRGREEYESDALPVLIENLIAAFPRCDA